MSYFAASRGSSGNYTKLNSQRWRYRAAIKKYFHTHNSVVVRGELIGTNRSRSARTSVPASTCSGFKEAGSITRNGGHETNNWRAANLIGDPVRPVPPSTAYGPGGGCGPTVTRRIIYCDSLPAGPANACKFIRGTWYSLSTRTEPANETFRARLYYPFRWHSSS